MRIMIPGLALAFAACATVPPPPVPGATYRALGTEPFWGLTIDRREIVFTEANAPGTRIVQPTPRVIVGVAGEIYQTPRINVNIVHTPCSDGMSDRTYPDKVQVRVDGRAFEGCGGDPLAPATLANTSWQVLAVNGRETPGGDRYMVTFQGDRMSARFGCNTMGGSFQVQGTTLTVGRLAATRMACGDMSAENAAARILAQPVQLSLQPGDRMLLQNGAGSIVLRRSY